MKKDRSLSWTRTVSLLLALVLVSLALILLSQGKQLSPVESAAGGVFTPVQQFAHDATSGVGSWIDSMRRAHELEEDNKKLRAALDSVTAENATLQQTKRENEELRKLLKFQTDRPDLPGVLANNIGGDGSGQMEMLTIDQGTADGIKTGQAVVSSGGIMVGQVYAVKKDRATVLLITDHASKIPVATDRTRTPGILEGKWQEGGRLLMSHIPRDGDVKENDLLLTTGVGGDFPKGLIVGQISKVRQNDVQSEKEAEALPLVGLNSLETVLVITGGEGK